MEPVSVLAKPRKIEIPRLAFSQSSKIINTPIRTTIFDLKLSKDFSSSPKSRFSFINRYLSESSSEARLPKLLKSSKAVENLFPLPQTLKSSSPEHNFQSCPHRNNGNLVKIKPKDTVIYKKNIELIGKSIVIPESCKFKYTVNSPVRQNNQTRKSKESGKNTLVNLKKISKLLEATGKVRKTKKKKQLSQKSVQTNHSDSKLLKVRAEDICESFLSSLSAWRHEKISQNTSTCLN